MKSRPILLLLIFSFILLNMAGHIAAVELYLRPSIEPTGQFLRMEDIFLPAKTDEINIQSIEKIPHPARNPALLAVAEVRKALMPFLSNSIISENITLVGRYTVFLPDSLTAEEKPLYRALFEQLNEKAAFPVTRIEASIQNVNRYGYGISENAGGVFRVTPLGSGNKSKESSEHPSGPIYITAELKAYAVCAVTVSPLRWGDPLNSTTVEFREVVVPIEKLDSLIAETFPINWYETRTRKAPGDIIFSTDIEKKTMVQAGKPVAIYYARDTIRLILRGKAYTSGGFQEIVSVKPENSTKKLDAEVIGYSEVRIEVR